MSDKDPVREHIERDLEQFCPTPEYEMPSHIKDELEASRNSGIAIAEYQDKIAWNRCLDEVIREIDNESDYLMMSWKTKSAAALQDFKGKLEKLRR